MAESSSLSKMDTLDPQPIPRSRVDSKGRVHFLEAQVTPDHSGLIHLEMAPDSTHADAHLGFLQKNRRYGLQITVPQYLGDNIAVMQRNPHIVVAGSKTNEARTKHVLDLEFTTHKDGLQNEELSLKVDGQMDPFILTLSARVLGPGKGTPMLKEGIHLLAVENDEDTSDVSTTTNANGRNSSIH